MFYEDVFDWSRPSLLRQLVVSVLLILAVTVAGSFAFGAWGPLGCPAVAGQATLGFYPSSLYPGQLAYWDGKDYTVYFRPSDRAISYRLKDGSYTPYITGQDIEGYFGQAVLVEPEGNLPTGVDWEKVKSCPAGYFFQGQEIDRRTAMALAADGIPDELNLPWLVAIGDKDFLEKAETAILLTPGSGNFRKQYYSPDDWCVERFELDKNVAFQQHQQALLLMLPGDSNSEQRVVHLQYDLNDGSAGLKKVLAAFDPTKVPDLRNPLGWNIAWPDWVPPWARNWQTAVVVLVVGYLLLKKGGQ